MALNFPSSPTIGQVYTDTTSGFSYEWDGTVWRSFSPSSSSQIRALDDISSSFDNTTTTFPLTSNGTPITPPSPQSLIINLGGVIQDPTDDYSVSGANLTFSTPPASGLSFSGISLGPAVPINTIPDGTVTDGSLNVSNNLSVVGVVSATEFYGDGSQLTGISGGVGDPTGDVDGLFNYVAAAATITQNITFDNTNSGDFNSYVLSIVPSITIAPGVEVIVGSSKTVIVDALNLAGLSTFL
jgi:hypothetical protein